MASPQAATATFDRWNAITLDCLRHVTTFLLQLREVAAVSAACATWRSAVTTGLRPRGDRLEVSSLEEINALIASPLVRRHCAALIAPVMGYLTSHRTRSSVVLLEDQHLLTLRHGMTHLEHLACDVDCSTFIQRRFPPTLKTLHVGIRSPSEARLTATEVWAGISHTMADIASTCRSLTSLKVESDSTETVDDEMSIPRGYMPLSVLEPLLQLRETLTSCSIDFDKGLDFTALNGDQYASLPASYIGVLRSLTNCTDISICQGTWTPNELEWLASEDSHRFRRIDLKCTNVSNTHAHKLSRFTGLTEFHPSWLDARDLSFLGKMAQLQNVRLRCNSVVDTPLLIAALANCPRIHTMHLLHARMISDHLCSLLSALPVIRHLTLEQMNWLSTLSFASSVPHLSSTLESCSLILCREIPPTELYHLRSCTNIRNCVFKQSFSSPPGAAILSSMTPGSATFDRASWPNLTECQFNDASRVLVRPDHGSKIISLPSALRHALASSSSRSSGGSEERRPLSCAPPACGEA